MILKTEHLEWDSEFFGLTIKRSFLNGTVSQADIDAIQVIEADLLYIFLSEDSQINRERIEELGGVLVDQKVTFEKELDEATVLPDHIYFKKVETTSPHLEKLAWQSGEFSRFNTDERLKPYYRKLYSQWLEKSISKELAAEVWIAYSSKEEGNPAGFITLSKDDRTGQIGLIAVDTAARGKGVGQALVSLADARFSVWGLSSAKVVTQGHNLAATKLYERMGYTRTDEQPIYHLWKKAI